MVVFDGALTLTYNAATMQLNTGGVNYTTAVGDRAFIRADTTTNMIVTIVKASGGSVVAPVSLSSSLNVATTSGTTVDVTLTGTPTRITIAMNRVSGASNTDLGLQFGTGSPGIIATGYLGYVSKLSAAAVVSASSGTTIINLTSAATAAANFSGVVTMQHIGGHTWSVSWVLSNTADAVVCIGAANVALGAQITTVRLSAIGGANFDSGSISTAWD